MLRKYVLVRTDAKVVFTSDGVSTGREEEEEEMEEEAGWYGTHGSSSSSSRQKESLLDIFP